MTRGIGPLSLDLMQSGYFLAYPMMTYNFVHRTHLEVFNGTYYPLPFPNGYVDPWLQDVYKSWPRASWVVADVHVTNRLTTSLHNSRDPTAQTRYISYRNRHT